MFDKHTLLQFADLLIKCSNDDSLVDRTLFNKVVNYMLEHSLCYFNKDNGLCYPAILPKFGCGFSGKLTIKELNQIYIINKEFFEDYTVNYKISRFHEIQSLSEDEIHIYSDLPFYSFSYFTDDLKCEYEKDEDDKITDYYPRKYNLNKSSSRIENFLDYLILLLFYAFDYIDANKIKELTISFLGFIDNLFFGTSSLIQNNNIRHPLIMFQNEIKKESAKEIIKCIFESYHIVTDCNKDVSIKIRKNQTSVATISLRLFIENISKYNFTYNDFVEIFLVNNIIQNFSDKLCQFEEFNKGCNRQSDDFEKYISLFEDFKVYIKDSFLALNQKEIHTLLSLLDCIDCANGSDIRNKRLESFKSYLFKIIEIASNKEYIEKIEPNEKKIIQESILLSNDFKGKLEKVNSLESLNEFLDEYKVLRNDSNFTCDMRWINHLHMDYLINNLHMNDAQVSKYNLWIYWIILKEAYCDLTGQGFTFHGSTYKVANEWVLIINEILKERCENFISINTSKYGEICNSEEEKKKIVVRFFESAKDITNNYSSSKNFDYTRWKLKSYNEEYDAICNNKELIQVIVASQKFKEDSFDIYYKKRRYIGFEGDFTFVIVGFVKAVERYLKEILIQKFDSKGLEWNNDYKRYDSVTLEGDSNNLTIKDGKNSFVELAKASFFIVNHLSKRKDLLQGIELFKFKFEKDNDGKYRPHNLFNDIFVKEVRNGHLHVHPIKTADEAIELYKKTAFFFRKAIDELMFLDRLE